MKVMRARIGDTVELVNGRGLLAEATVVQMQRHACRLDITSTSTSKPDPFKLVVAQSLPRLNRLDTIVEKGTELGMHMLWLFPGERSERKELSEQQEQRLHSIAVSALKQSGRLYLPEIFVKPPLVNWNNLPFPAFYGSLNPNAPLFSTSWQQTKPEEGVLFFVGPEAGFSEAEIQHLERLGAKGVNLHRNILRTDTASLVALSLIHHWMLKR